MRRVSMTAFKGESGMWRNMCAERQQRIRWLAVVRACLIGLFAVPLVVACNVIDSDVAATRTVVGGSPVPTLTPSGDVLRIEGSVVRSVLIPDPAQGAAYAMTDTELFFLEHGRWTPTGAGVDNRRVVVDPSNPLRLLRGNHPICSAPQSSAGVPLQASDDGGRTWYTLPDGENVRPIAFDNTIPAVVYGSDCGLAISSDGGEHWLRLKITPGSDLVTISATGESLYIMEALPGGVSQVRAVNVSDPEAPVVGEPLLELAGTATLDARGGRVIVGAIDAIHISDDGGLTWGSSRIGLEGVTAQPTVQPERWPGVAEVDQFGIRVVRIEPHNIHRIYAGTPHGLYISQDDGVTWVRYTTVSVESKVLDIQFGLNDADLYITTTEGVVVVPSP